MKEIMFVTGSMGRGGAERVISLLSERYVRMGWKVSILMLLHSYVGYELNPQVEIIDISNDKVKAVLDVPRLVVKTRSLMKQRKPHTVVAFMAQNCMVTGLACRGLDVRLVLSERIDPAMVKRGKLYEALLFDIYAKADVTVLQTKRARDYFPQKVRRNSVIIGNPIAVKCTASATRKKRIVTAGRLDKQKNQAMLIEAFAALHEQYPDYILDIYGEGPLRQTLQQRIDGLGLGGCATLKGSVTNIHEEMADAEIFVLPSDFEGLSNALLEAMMMGLPCIATDCAGCDEVIENGVNGLLIPVGDTQALVQALLTLAKNPDEARKMGQNAMVSTEAFDLDSVIDQWRKAIEG